MDEKRHRSALSDLLPTSISIVKHDPLERASFTLVQLQGNSMMHIAIRCIALLGAGLATAPLIGEEQQVEPDVTILSQIKHAQQCKPRAGADIADIAGKHRATSEIPSDSL
jgi:hypothetical protein